MVKRWDEIERSPDGLFIRGKFTKFFAITLMLLGTAFIGQWGMFLILSFFER